MSKVKDKLLGVDEPADDREEYEDPDQVEPDESTGDPFRDEQKAKAESQGMTADNAVPEQRPIASLRMNDTYSPLTQQLRDRGAIGKDETPMPRSAYDKASSDAQLQSAADESKIPQIHPGMVVRATIGPHEGRIIAVTRIVSFRSPEDLGVYSSGSPEQRFVRPLEIEGRARGDDRDGEVLILNVDENGLEIVRDYRGTGRG